MKEIDPGTMESKLVKRTVFRQEKCWIWMRRPEDLICRLPGLPDIRRGLRQLMENDAAKEIREMPAEV